MPASSTATASKQVAIGRAIKGAEMDIYCPRTVLVRGPWDPGRADAICECGMRGRQAIALRPTPANRL
jgi:hypothetical protein